MTALPRNQDRDGRRRIRRAQRVLAAAVAASALAAAPATGVAAPSVARTGTPVTTVALQVHPDAGAPCVVTGYTLHAEEQMASRNISSDQVETVVLNNCSRATWRKSNSTWQYTDGRILVSANTNGYVVTVIRL